jgi:Domain of unknown function (DUF4129)
MTSREPAVPQRRPTTSTGVPPALAKILLVALLLVLVLLGLRGGLARPGWAGPYHRDGIAVGAGLEIILAALLAAVLVRGRRAPDDFLAARLRGVLRAVLLAGLIAIPAALLVSARLRGRPPPARPPGIRAPHGRPAVPHRLTAPGSFQLPVADLLYALLSLALLAAIAACVVLLRRHRPRAGPRPPDEASLADAEPERAGLSAAVSSGRRALAELDDSRSAIIACYLAMERSLGQAGASRDSADTPDEFLARAAAAGLVRGSAATQLTGLFYEARFSTHQLTSGQRGAAERALRQLASDLSGSR